jgi:nucleotide-binding universal stress UspA family protein
MPQAELAVLAGTSLKAGSDEVVRAAASLARAAGAELHIAHAFPFPLAGSVGPDAELLELLAEEQQSLRQRVLQQAERAGVARREVSALHLRPGPPHRVLVEAAQETGADLIVVGAAEGAGAFSRMLGSTADRVIRGARCPVLVVRGELAVPHRILLPVDLSPLSADAMRCGLALLGRLAPPAGLACEALLIVSPLLYKELMLAHGVEVQDVGEIARRELEAFVDRQAPPGSAVVSRIRHGDVVDGILEEIAARRPDLVVMGTHGLGGFERFLIGSATAGVVRRAPGAVLVVPPEAALRNALASEREALASPPEIAHAARS